MVRSGFKGEKSGKSKIGKGNACRKKDGKRRTKKEVLDMTEMLGDAIGEDTEDQVK